MLFGFSKKKLTVKIILKQKKNSKSAKKCDSKNLYFWKLK